MLESIPDNFLWGASLHSHCVEGGDHESDWCRWEKRPGNIADNTTSERGADFKSHYKDDIRVARDFGLNALLITLEWSRIQPKEGPPNKKAMAHYFKLLTTMRDAGITPIVALSHVTLPIWIADNGGWLNAETVDQFRTYAEAVVESLGDLCNHWIPILEPTHLAQRAYRLGHWPPNVQSARNKRTVDTNLLNAHRAGYETIKEANADAQVGVGIRIADYTPSNPYRAWDARAAHQEASRCNHAFLDALAKNNQISSVVDFIGLSYFGSQTVTWNWRASRRAFVQYAQDGPRSLRCTPCPAAFEKLLHTFRNYSIPFYILGNGSDSDDDAEQCGYLLNHLQEVSQMLKRKIDIRGYFYYGLLDGFEWERGYTSRRGLFHVDPERLTRTPKPVALMLKELIATGAVRTSTMQQFCPDRVEDTAEKAS
ncbi:MAG: family 1 glycosylhydrolase [Candidatus Hydrogenedentota bacterium]